MIPEHMRTPEFRALQIAGTKRAAAERATKRALTEQLAALNGDPDISYSATAKAMRAMSDTDSLSTARWVSSGLEWHSLAARFGKEFDWLSAPSVEAMALLRWVLEDPENKKVFWTQAWTKLLPTRQQIEQGSKYRDDGRNVVELLDRYERGVALKK